MDVTGSRRSGRMNADRLALGDDLHVGRTNQSVDVRCCHRDNTQVRDNQDLEECAAQQERSMKAGSSQQRHHLVAWESQLARRSEDRQRECWGRTRESCWQKDVDHERGVLAYGMGEGDCCTAVHYHEEANCHE
jgi:hypothetical protein